MDDYTSVDFPLPGGNHEGDRFLRTIVTLVNGRHFACSVILATAGGVIQGTLIDRRLWMKMWEDSVTRAGGGHIAKAFREMFADGSPALDDEMSENDLPTRLHLRDAHAGALGPMLMRIRLDAVIGWSMGIERHE